MFLISIGIFQNRSNCVNFSGSSLVWSSFFCFDQMEFGVDHDRKKNRFRLSFLPRPKVVSSRFEQRVDRRCFN
jgi:hypothetical protein